MVENPRRGRRALERTSEPENEQEVPEPINVDFSNSDSRSDYLKRKLDGILNNIGEGYGKRLTEEFIQRLERTLKSFHKEVTEMLDELHEIEIQRINEKSEDKIQGVEPLEGEWTDLSEREKRLEMQEKEKQGQESVSKESTEQITPTKKKRLFRKSSL